jgi:thiol:disulfide interchange protein
MTGESGVLTSGMEIMKGLLKTRAMASGALVVLLFFGWMAVVRAAGSAGYDPRRDPAADLRAAVEEAQRSGRRILLEVGGEWCVWCHVFQDLVDKDKEVAARLRDGFVVVKVNWSPENENTRFLSAYPPIPGYPHFFVLESDGTYLRSQPVDPFTQGSGYDRAKVLAFLKQWSPPVKRR